MCIYTGLDLSRKPHEPTRDLLAMRLVLIHPPEASCGWGAIFG
jgi:hypothetical protein